MDDAQFTNESSSGGRRGSRSRRYRSALLVSMNARKGIDRPQGNPLWVPAMTSISQLFLV